MIVMDFIEALLWGHLVREASRPNCLAVLPTMHLKHLCQLEK